MQIRNQKIMPQKVTFGNLIKYGVFLGLVLIILSLIKIYLGNFIDYLGNFINRDVIRLIFTLLETAAYVFFVYCAIRFVVKYIYTTNYSFAKGVKVGLFIGLITAIMMSVYKYIEMKYLVFDVEQMPSDIAITVVGAFVSAFLISLLASLFISPFFKKRKQTTDFKEEQTDN
jgi:hypothetical protein